MKKTIKAYKGFNKDLTCNGFQYKEGKTYKTDKAKCCETGFHSCRNPMDVWSYYDLASSVFHEVEVSGEIDTHKVDSKIASTEIKIGKRLDLQEYIKASIDFCLSTQAASGYYAKQAASGYYATQETTGKNCISMIAGHAGKAKGKIGSWIVLSEWKTIDNEFTPTCVKAVQIDGKIIKEDTFYMLKDCEFIEVK